MKKYLLFIISMLCVSIGAWADPTEFGTSSTYEISGTTISVYIGTEGDMASWPNPSLSGITKAIITGTIHGNGSDNNGGGSDGDLIGSKFQDMVLDLSGATLVLPKDDNSSSYVEGYVIGNASQYPKNIIIPNGKNPATFIVYSAYNVSRATDINYYSVSGTTTKTINAAFNTPTSSDAGAGLVNLNLISSATETTILKVVKDITTQINLSSVASTTNSNITTIDLSGITTTGTTATNPITVPSTATTVICSSTGVAARVTPTEHVLSTEISCAATELADKITALTTAGAKPTSITITSGSLDAATLSGFNGSTYSEVTRLDLRGATLSALTDLQLPQNIESLVLPTGNTVDAIKTRIASSQSLKYVYSPNNGSTASNNPDYVFVNKAGGMAQAIQNESTLRSGVYYKIASTVALSSEDMNFNPTSNKPTAYEYLDFSGANISSSTAFVNSSSVTGVYRIILPDSWTASQMDTFKTNSTLGDHVAAVYSYQGTKLNIYGITENYNNNALSDSRIVRSGTTALDFVEGSKFSDNMRQAINNSTVTTIKSVTISTSDFITTNSTALTNLTIDNDNITQLVLTGLTNNATVDVNADGCAILEDINLDGVVIKSVSANCSALRNVSMNGVSVAGDVKFEGTALTSFTASTATSKNISGDIYLRYNNSLASVDISGVSMTGLGTTDGDLRLTRKSGDDDVTDCENEIYNNIRNNITTSTTFGNGTGTGKIVPNCLTATAEEPYSASTFVGYRTDGCGLTIGISHDATDTNFRSLSAALTYLGTLGTPITSSCNLTVTIKSGSTYKLSATDISAINSWTFTSDVSAGVLYKDATLNLDGVTASQLEDGVLTTTEIANSSVHNIILPQGLNKSVVCAENFDGCTSLKSAISLNSSRTDLVGYVKTPGSLRTTMSQVPEFQPNQWNYLQAVSIANVTLSGKLIAQDVATASVNLDSNGNFFSGGNSSVSTAFENKSTLRTLDIKDAVFVDATDNSVIKPENMTLSMLGWGGITSVTLPTDPSMTTIPANMFRGCSNLTKVCIPHNYQYLNNAIFIDSGVNHITTTDSKGVEIDNGNHTITLSANLKRIGETPASGTALAEPVFCQNQKISDLYSLATKTPTCYANAFPADMCYGWGGFQGGNYPYCREKYKNGTNLFTVLHFPSETSWTEAAAEKKNSTYLEMKKYYTDYTKVYSMKEQTGAVDANGDPILWPTFSELRRAFNQATNEQTWNDWTVEYDINHEVNGGSYIPTSASDVAEGTHADDYGFSGYEGWHQITLSLATYVKPDEENVVNEVVTREYVETDRWYTFCIPFDITADQLQEMLGVPKSTESVINKVYKKDGTTLVDESPNGHNPEARTLVGVIRTPATTGKNQVTFNFTQPLVQEGSAEYGYWHIDDDSPGGSSKAGCGSTTPRAGSGVESRVIAMRGGLPYIVKPYLPKGVTVNNLGKYVMERFAGRFTEDQACGNHGTDYYEQLGSRNKVTSRFVKPYEKHKIQAFRNSETNSGYLKHNDNTKYYYAFIGQFEEQDLPQYALYMVGGKWYRYASGNKGYKLQPYRCVIMASKEVNDDLNSKTGSGKYRSASRSQIPTVVKELTDDDIFSDRFYLGFEDGRDDADFTDGDVPSAARQVNYVFSVDDNITEFDENGDIISGIDNLDGEDLKPAISDGKIYNMTGQYVGTSLDDLSKGMYIMNGRKFVVK